MQESKHAKGDVPSAIPENTLEPGLDEDSVYAAPSGYFHGSPIPDAPQDKKDPQQFRNESRQIYRNNVGLEQTHHDDDSVESLAIIKSLGLDDDTRKKDHEVIVEDHEPLWRRVVKMLLGMVISLLSPALGVILVVYIIRLLLILVWFVVAKLCLMFFLFLM